MCKVKIFVLLVLCQQCFSQDTLKIFYEINSSVANVAVIDSFVQLMDLQESQVRILGYADGSGSHEYNLTLSKERANGVKNHLKKFWKEVRVTECKGLGEVISIADTTPFGNQANRRVDLIFSPQPLDITKSKVNDTLRIAGLNFIGGEDLPTNNSFRALEELLQIMKSYPKVKIEIQGHVCCTTESEGFDLKTGRKELSVNRAKYVYNYLLNKGIDGKRMSYKGFGSTRPKYPTGGKKEELNRRVEIMILER